MTFQDRVYAMVEAHYKIGLSDCENSGRTVIDDVPIHFMIMAK